MKLLIDISKETYIHLRNGGNIGTSLLIENAIKNGTPIPDNATFGDVIEKITNRKLLEDNKDAENIIISTKLWNAPYQKK